MLALLHRRLGGSLTIGSNGQRYLGHPFRRAVEDIPQLPDTEPHEQFHSTQEWQGALKLVEALLSRLDDSDSELIYGLLASVAVDNRKFAPTIDDPQRKSQ